MGSSCQVAGYWYSAGMHLVFCTGVDELLSIVAGEKTVWSTGAVSYTVQWTNVPYCYDPTSLSASRVAPTLGECPEDYTLMPNYIPAWVPVVQPQVTANTSLYIAQLGLFGGQDRSGGIQGQLDVMFGGPTQGVNSYLASQLGANIPAYRGVFSFVLRGMILSCNTPQIEPWGIRARRTITGWEPTEDRIADDMNPAHIVCDCLFDADWGGVGLPETKRGDSFALVSNTLYNEQFGLSFLWARNGSIESFVATVLRHINASVYQDYTTGKLEMKLIRDDYGDVSSLPKFDTTNIISLENYDAKSTAELINTVTIKYTDPSNGKDQSLTLSDISSVDRAEGSILPMEKDFFGVSSASLASQIAIRELQAAILPLATCTFLANRTGANIQPGQVINFTWEPLGFIDVAMRVQAVDIGTLDSSVVRIDCIMDVFAFGDSVLEDPPDSTNWSDPLNDPADITDFSARELTYWQLTRQPLLMAQADVANGAFLHVTATKPTQDSDFFTLWDREPSEYEYGIEDRGTFSELRTTTEVILPGHVTDVILDAPIGMNEVISGAIEVGSLAYLGEEIVSVAGISENLLTVTFFRGLIDTVPQEHPIGTDIQFISTTKTTTSQRQFFNGDSCNYKMLPTTTNGELNIADATERTYNFTGRLGKPYPPGRVLFNNEPYPVEMDTRGDYFLNDVIDATTVKSTVTALGGYEQYYAIDPSTSLTGTAAFNSWWFQPGGSNQKLSVDLGAAFSINQLILENFHDVGGSGVYGVKTFDFYGTNSQAAFDSTNPADLTDLTFIGNVAANQHVASDISDPQLFEFEKAGSFRYVVLVITEYWSGTYAGIRDLKIGASGHFIKLAHRDRLQQINTAQVTQQSVSVGPEAGTTYNLVITDADTSAPIYSSLLTSDLIHEFLPGDSVSRVKVTLESVRDGQVSYQQHDFTTTLVGYGKSYGTAYGGKA